MREFLIVAFIDGQKKRLITWCTSRVQGEEMMRILYVGHKVVIKEV